MFGKSELNSLSEVVAVNPWEDLREIDAVKHSEHCRLAAFMASLENSLAFLKVNSFFKPKCYCKRDEKFSGFLTHEPFASIHNNNNKDGKIAKVGFCEDINKQKTVKMKDSRIEALMQDFLLTESQINEIYKRLDCEIHKGLRKSTNKEADIKCFITYVHHLPQGDEHGNFLALDLGGTNFRVLLAKLEGAHDVKVESKIYAIPKELMIGTGMKLFDHIAECLAKFVLERKIQNDNLPLGFTFSFPCFQVGLTKAILKTWTKGFKASGVENEDIGRLFSEAVARRGDIKVHLAAILNDTTGTLMSCAHRNPNCRIGVIIGTGCNSCYVEDVENVELLEEEIKCKNDKVVINTEWGAFGDNGSLDFIRTKYDRNLEGLSINPGRQTYEKMISGMYLGELTRLVFLEAVEQKLFNFPNMECVQQILCKPDTIKTLILSLVEEDKIPEFANTKKFFTEVLSVQKPTVEECLKFKYICECIGRRAAYLAGIGISVLLNKIEDSTITVGIDGTLYRKHPRFYIYMGEVLKKLVDPKKKYDIMISEDGSGVGAALVAAVENHKLK